MNYELLTIILSAILLLITFMQYYNNKHNFLKEKLPIVNIKRIDGFYLDDNLKFMIVLENIGDSPAVDIIIKIRLNEIEKIQYDKINFLKDTNNVIVEFCFSNKECREFINRLKNNKQLFKKAFKNDKEVRNQILLPVLSLEIYYKNIFDKCYKLSYNRGMYKLDDINIENKKVQGINFISDNSVMFSLKKIRKIKFNKIVKNYYNSLPFIKLDEK